MALLLYFEETSPVGFPGMKTGGQKGHAEGLKANRREAARCMNADGMSAELITKYTALTVDTDDSL